jgi:effector-binding domain-containing protein
MLEPLQVTASPAQLIALIPLTIARTDMRTMMGPAIGELMATLAAQGIAPGGPWFCHHLRIDPALFDFEVSVPVSSAVTAAGRVKPGQLPAMYVVRTIYHGPYEGLGAAWGQFNAEIEAAGFRPGADFWERYLAGPESGSNPAHWRTELSRALPE